MKDLLIFQSFVVCSKERNARIAEALENMDLSAKLLTGNYSNLPLDITILLLSTVKFVILASMALR